jgi:O-antigen ligase
MTRGPAGRRGPPAGAPAADPGATIAAAALAVAVAGSALLVDPGAEAAFDAPKRLVALGGIAVAAAALVVLPGPSRGASLAAWRAASTGARAVALLALAALAGAAVAALASPRPAVALDAWRVLALGALVLPLGASRALEGRRARVVVGTFFCASAINTVVSAWQIAGGRPLFPVLLPGGRGTSGGLAGNEAYAALALALAAVLALGLAVHARAPGVRVAAGAGAALFTGGVLVNASLTALLALAVGAAVPLAVRFRRRALLPAALALLVAAGASAALAPLRARVVDAGTDFQAGNWDRLLTYRFGPWAAAVEMARGRPLIGWGPGTFAAEFVDHRLAAELRLHTRFVNPWLTGSYSEAHSEYLQALAEVGLPATAAALAAVATLLVGLGRVAWRRQASGGAEATVLLALLVAGAVAALTWFPLQRPIIAVPLLLAAGRGWRIARGDPG